MNADPVVALLPVTQDDVAAANALDDALGFLTDLERPIVEQAFARHRIAHRTPAPAGDVREACRIARINYLIDVGGALRPSDITVAMAAFDAGYDAALASPTPDSSAAGDVLARHVAEVMEEDGGCWTACSGCQESDEGSVSEKYYPYSPIFKCQPGGGCRECGGIGVIWQDGAFLASYGDALSTDSAVSGSAEVLREVDHG